MPIRLTKPLQFLSIIILLLALWAFGTIEALLGVSRAEAAAVVIVLLTAYGWVTEVVPLFLTSLGVLLAGLLWAHPLALSEGSLMGKEAYYLAFFGDLTLLFLGGFVLSSLMNKYGLAQRLATAMLQRTGDQPERVLLGVIAVSALLSMWMSNTATAAMMFAVMGPIWRQLPEEAPFRRALALGIPFACNLGGLGTPIGTPPNAIAIVYLEQAGINFSFLGWMGVSLPLLIVLAFLLWKILLRIHPPGDIRIQRTEADTRAFTWAQRGVMLVFSLAVLGWITSSFTGISTGTVGLAVVVFAYGSGLLKVDDFRALPWDILFMLGGGLCLGVLLADSGLTNTVSELIPDDGGFLVSLLGCMVLSAGMTTFMSNTATANLLLPLAVGLPSFPLLYCLAIAMMCSCAMVLPVSTPPNAIAFGSGLLRAKDMHRPALMILGAAFSLILIAALIYSLLALI